MTSRTWPLGATVIGVLALFAYSSSCNAQPMETAAPSEEITVTAPYLVHKKEIKNGPHLAVLAITVQRRVHYGDLNLAIPSQANLFKARIASAAKEACNQLDKLYPRQTYVPISSVEDCAHSATEGAMPVVTEIIRFWR